MPGAVLMAVELPNPRTLGVRYLLPVVALWIVVASPIALVAGRRMMAVTLGLVLAAAGVDVAVAADNLAEAKAALS